jgi:bisphosphoglycerate-independent phosphoglycerate mutase (AlkP superfamily)
MNKRVILLILDGWGQGTKYPGNAIELANTPHFDNLIKTISNRIKPFQICI